MSDPTMTLNLTPQEARAIIRAQDKWPPSEATPEGFFEVQTKIGAALDANPAAKQAYEALP
jgi:hypothetical protein